MRSLEADAKLNGHSAKIDLATGELKCPRCAELKPGDLENAEKEIRRLRRKVKALERDREEERQGDERHEERADDEQEVERDAGRDRSR